jgi:hypothetical protein
MAPECLAFAVALAVMAGIAMLELIALLFGTGLGHALDSLLPDVELHLEVGEASVLEKVLGFLRFGRVPALVVLVTALTCFGLSGLVLQASMRSASGSLLPLWLASTLALVAALPLTRFMADVIGRVLPREHTSAVSRAAFVGRVATMLKSEARRGKPAQAKLHDHHGQHHYILVEPEDDLEVLAASEPVLLVRQAGARFMAIRKPHALLSADTAPVAREGDS